MNRKRVFFGAAFIFLGLWFYLALGTFKVEERSGLNRLVIKEGIARSERYVSEVLAGELEFDLKAAYESGFTSFDVIEYLITQPHTYDVSAYNGVYYEGRKTISPAVPYSVCSVFIIIGVITILLNIRRK